MHSIEKWLRRIPALRRRDTQIHEQNAEIRRLRHEVTTLNERVDSLDGELQQERREAQDTRERLLRTTGRPSLRREIVGLRNAQRAVRTLDPNYLTAFSQIPHKLRNYQFADSHGVRTPDLLAVWDSITTIDLSAMPEEFVLKADGGAGGISVFLLRRTSGGGFEALDGSGTLTLDDIRARLTGLGSRRARPPFFAEPVLSVHGRRGIIPEDVKIYTGYGEIFQVLLRRVGTHRDRTTVRYRYLDEDREDLGQADKYRAMDRSLAVPERFDEMIAIARHLSRAAGVPFCRVDLYDTPGAATLGEITRAPGGDHFYTAAHDRRMGAAAVGARIRLEQDLVRGRPPGAIFGRLGRLDPYRGVSLPSEISNPRDWPVHTVACQRWCLPD